MCLWSAKDCHCTGFVRNCLMSSAISDRKGSTLVNMNRYYCRSSATWVSSGIIICLSLQQNLKSNGIQFRRLCDSVLLRYCISPLDQCTKNHVFVALLPSRLSIPPTRPCPRTVTHNQHHNVYQSSLFHSPPVPILFPFCLKSYCSYRIQPRCGLVLAVLVISTAFRVEAPTVRGR